MNGIVVGGVGVGGTDDQGDEWTTMAPIALESRVSASSFSKATIENMQFLGFYTAAQVGGIVPALQSYERPPSDPPDAVIKTDDSLALAVELTTLSTTQVTRQRFAEIRLIGRLLDDRLKADSEAFSHLVGRVVGLGEIGHDQERPPKRNQQQVAELVDAFVAALKKDFGVVQGIPIEDVRAGLPDTLTPEMLALLARGRKSIEQYMIEVHASSLAGSPPSVVTNVTITISNAKLREQLIELVNAKDDARNQILLISTGLIDPLGYVGTADSVLFERVVGLVRGGLKLSPKHLNQVILHHWGSHQFLVLYDRPDSPTLIDTSGLPHIGPPAADAMGRAEGTDTQ
jgi:hypothetical protein